MSIETALLFEMLADKIEDVLMPDILDSIEKGGVIEEIVAIDYVWNRDTPEPQNKHRFPKMLIAGYKNVPVKKEILLAEVHLREFAQKIRDMAESIKGDI